MDLATGTVKPGVPFSNNGFWDTFRTTFPLFALIIPEHYHRFLEGFLNSYRDTGFLPKWLAPDERGMMPGTLLDGIIADSACKDMAPDLEEELLQAMLETASKSDPRHQWPPRTSPIPRTGLPLYRPPRKRQPHPRLRL